MKADLSEKQMSLPMTNWPSSYDHDPKPDEPFEEIFWIELGNGSVIETNLVGLFSPLGGQCHAWETFVHCFVFWSELNSRIFHMQDKTWGTSQTAVVIKKMSHLKKKYFMSRK